MKKIFLFGLVFCGLQTLVAEQISEQTTSFISAINDGAAVDMYHYTDNDELELQAAIIDFNLAQSEYQDLASKYSVISFKALDSGGDGCRIEIYGKDYYLHGYKASSDRYYSNLTVKDSGDYTYSTVNNSSRTIPSYTVCSSEELRILANKRIQAAQAQLKYSKLAKNKSVKIGNERALKANTESAEKGETYGLRRMAERYSKGDGVEKNLKKAEELFKKAEEAGLSEESKSLAARQIHEENADKQNFELAQRATDNGSYTSAATLARYYRDGKGTDKDLKKALEYFEKARALKPYNPVPDSIQTEMDEVKRQLKPSEKTN